MVSLGKIVDRFDFLKDYLGSVSRICGASFTNLLDEVSQPFSVTKFGGQFESKIRFQ